MSDHDGLYCGILSELLPGVNRQAKLLAPLVSVADMLTASKGRPGGLSTKAAKAMHDWDRARLGAALDVIRGQA